MTACGDCLARTWLIARLAGSIEIARHQRRRLREIVRRNQQGLKGGIWFVVIARRSAAQNDSAALEAEWLGLARRAGIL